MELELCFAHPTGLNAHQRHSDADRKERRFWGSELWLDWGRISKKHCKGAFFGWSRRGEAFRSNGREGSWHT